MGTLGDELKKAGFANRRQEKKIAHQERVERKVLGEQGIDRAREERERELRARQAEKRERDRHLNAQLTEKRLEAEAVHRLREIVDRESLRGRTAGPRRFYFVDRRGRIPFFEVSDEVGDRLARGDLAIVETPHEAGGAVCLVPRDAARRVDELDPPSVRFWHR